MKKNKGFTLIELLVVIAIIGILASIVLVSLGTARNKAKDAGIKADLSGMRAAAELYASGNNDTYLNFCTDAGSLGGARILSGMESSMGVLPANDDCNVDATGSAWAACAQLNAADPKGAFCVDSNGNAKDMATKATCVDAWLATICP